MESIVWELRSFLLDIAGRCDGEEVRRIRALANEFCREEARIVEEREVEVHVSKTVDVRQVWHDVDEETGRPRTSSARAFLPKELYGGDWLLDPFLPRRRVQLSVEGSDERPEDFAPSPFTGLIKVQVRLEGETKWELFDLRERPFGKVLSLHATREEAEREASWLNREYLEGLPKGRRWRAKSPFGVRPQEWALVRGEGGIFYLSSEEMTSFQEEAKALLEKYAEERR